jgi:hypothetical protein
MYTFFLYKFYILISPKLSFTYGFFFSFFLVLGFEHRALCLLGKCSVATSSQSSFALVIFQLGSHAFLLRQASDHNPPTKFPLFLRLQPLTTTQSFFVEMGVSLTFSLPSNFNLPHLYPLSS